VYECENIFILTLEVLPDSKQATVLYAVCYIF